jgi:hypothetical protein
MSKHLTKAVWIAVCLGLVAIGVYALLRLVNPFPAVPASTAYCTVQKEADLPDISGLHFQLTRMSCDTFGNDVSVSLVVSKHTTDKGDVIFKYDPNVRSPIPTVALAGNHMQIAVPSVASIYFQAQGWQGLNIDYDIGSVLYPTTQPTATK